MTCSAISATETLAAALIQGLAAELYLTPKPGLVDLWDSGSHTDLSLPKMVASIELIGIYFEELLAALTAGETGAALIGIGRRAEARMHDRLATNTHKGAIFLCGLLLAARARIAGNDPELLQPAVASVAGEIIPLQIPSSTNGSAVRQNYRIGGILAEAAAGLPCLFDTALPTWHLALARQGDPLRAAFAMLAALMQQVEDSTALHRCGPAGLEQVRRDGQALERRIADGGDPIPLLQRLNDDYRRRNLTMGGVADMLGLAFGYLAFLGEPVPLAAEAICTR